MARATSYQDSMATATKSDLLYVRGAKSVIITSDQAVQIKIPLVPTGTAAPSNASGVKIESQAMSSPLSLVGPTKEPDGTYAGVIPEEFMPPYIFLHNTSGSTANVSVWITY